MLLNVNFVLNFKSVFFHISEDYTSYNLHKQYNAVTIIICF